MNKTLNFWMLPCAPCMVYLPTYATKSPRFVGKYTSAMEHMGLISGPVLFWGGEGSKKQIRIKKKQIGIKKKQNPENMRKHKETITK
jgi:hypothetical protein